MRALLAAASLAMLSLFGAAPAQTTPVDGTDKPCNPVNSPISSQQPDDCDDCDDDDHWWSDAMSGIPQGPGDISCISQPCNGACTGGPYASACGG
jgi:hypothetical protein